jgi:quercetin dioxygenase-like cupin family protein
MGNAERRTRRSGHDADRHTQRGHATVRADEHPLARGTDMSHGTIPLRFGTDIAMAQITVNPGGSSGWHSHPGGAIIIVQAGTLTTYRSVGRKCESTTYTAGQAFIERPGEVDQVLNIGSVPYVLYVTFPRVPPGGSTRTDQPDPGTCPGI